MPIFKIIRSLSRPMILTAEKLFNPPPIIREPMAQASIDKETANMAIYEYRGCPFCMKTRRALRRLSLKVELRDALNDVQHKKDLLEKGGKKQVPCLCITTEEGNESWLYESSDIIRFFEDKYDVAA